LASALERASAAAADTIRQNPLLVGGVGLAIGALLASALPSSRVEEKLVGGAVDRMKDSAREAAERAYETAKEAAFAAVDSAVERACEDGFSPESFKTAAADYIDRARNVANSALGAAAQPNSEKPH
jgi:flavin-binding protein dodecin